MTVPPWGAAEVDLHGGLVFHRLPPLPHLGVLETDRPGMLFSRVVAFLEENSILNILKA